MTQHIMHVGIWVGRSPTGKHLLALLLSRFAGRLLSSGAWGSAVLHACVGVRLHGHASGQCGRLQLLPDLLRTMQAARLAHLTQAMDG